MLLWMTLLLLASVSEQFENVPVISLHPPWTIAFQREWVKLTCSGFHSPGQTTLYYWYNEWKQLGRTRENTFEVRDSGNYRCQIQDSPQSKPVRLFFSTANLILQAPLTVFETDSVILRCRGKANIALHSVQLYKNKKLLANLHNTSDFHIKQASLKDNGMYQCKASIVGCCSVSSNMAQIQVQELLPHPVLKVYPTSPTEGSLVTLTCDTQLAPQRSDVQLLFRFFRKNQTPMTNWKSSPEFNVTLWKENSGSYSCEAQTVTSHLLRKSQKTYISVKGADAKIHTQPALHSIFEGRDLILICSVDGVPGPFRISWYRRRKPGVHFALMKTLMEREFRIPIVRSSDTGEYYCVANHPQRSFSSKPVTITVKVPVSPPVFTLTTPRTPALEGDMATLHCEAQRGSPPIQYQVFHEGVFLQKLQTTSWEPVHLSFPLTVQHSGSYYCTANNNQEAQRSETVSLSVTVPVSPPVFTLTTPRTPALEGDVVTLHCEAQKGSPPIFYQFYHEAVTMKNSSALTGGGVSFSFSLSTEHSGSYHCTGNNGFGPQPSEVVSLSITVPVSRPVLTIRTPTTQAAVGDVVELHCEAQRGSPPITYQFYHEDIALGSSSAPTGGGISFNFSLTSEHSGNYACVAHNSQGTQRSEMVPLRVAVPVSPPVLSLRVPRTQAVVGDVVELHCEAQRGSPPILYQFYHEDVPLGSSSAPYGGGASYSFSLTTEHSGSYSCQASNGLRVQHSEAVTLNVTVPVSHPVLTFRGPTQAAVGDMVELHCEAERGSPPILYRFYHEDVILENSSAPSRGGVFFNLSLTAEHSGNYSCEADNGLGAQRSKMVALFITGLTGSRSGSVTTGVTGGLLSMMGLAVVAVLLYHWIPRRSGGRPDSDSARSSSDSASPEHTYYNVPGWEELQPVYSNVNPQRGDVVYSEVQRIQKENKPTASALRLLKNTDSSVIYSQVKVASVPASGPQLLASSAPHR